MATHSCISNPCWICHPQYNPWANKSINNFSLQEQKNMKNIEIIGGGTISYVRNHLALTAPAYGTTAKTLQHYLLNKSPSHYNINCHLTKMASAGESNIETSEDVSKLVDTLIANEDTKIIFFNVALVDFDGSVVSSYYKGPTKSGKYEERLKTSEGEKTLKLIPTAKLISKIRRERKDIFLVGFKTTCGATEDEQFLNGLNLLKTSSCNLVLSNDTKTRINMIITPEQARYNVSSNRNDTLAALVDMTLARSKGHFTRSTVVDGESVPWGSSLVPLSLRKVVDHCIKAGAYKPFNGSTVGHFAVKISEKEFVTSKRKSNFNKLQEVGMVLCKAEETDTVIAYGSKPSVGGQSQRIIFKDHPETDCIVHFHCPPKPASRLSTRPQRYFECGSHECGKNTSEGLREDIPGIKCVYLDNHGPNIVFNRGMNPEIVINFINNNFDLSKSTDGVDRTNVPTV